MPKVVAQQRHGRGSNPRPLDRKSDALPLSHRATPVRVGTGLRLPIPYPQPFDILCRKNGDVYKDSRQCHWKGRKIYSMFSFQRTGISTFSSLHAKYMLRTAYLVLTLCGLALRSTRMTRPRVQRTSP